MQKSWIVIFFSLLITFSSCNKAFNKVLKSNDMEYKAEKAQEFFEKKKYDNALALYEELLVYYKGQKNVEQYYFNYAMSHYNKKDYLMAGFYFNQFTINYPRAEKTEAAAFLVADCYQKESLRYQLDQTSTIEAINKYQAFINRYPNSTRMEDANKAIDGLRAKLQKKAYESAYLYFRLKEYNAAAVSFRNVMNEYPDMAELEKAHYFVVKSLKLYADLSYQGKKVERYKEAIKEFEKFKTSYPNSTYMAELVKLVSAGESFIKNEESKQTTSNTDGKEERRN
jgi:outer membrane protein assembly factor BamD